MGQLSKPGNNVKLEKWHQVHDDAIFAGEEAPEAVRLADGAIRPPAAVPRPAKGRPRYSPSKSMTEDTLSKVLTNLYLPAVVDGFHTNVCETYTAGERLVEARCNACERRFVVRVRIPMSVEIRRVMDYVHRQMLDFDRSLDMHRRYQCPARIISPSQMQSMGVVSSHAARQLVGQYEQLKQQQAALQLQDVLTQLPSSALHVPTPE